MHVNPPPEWARGDPQRREFTPTALTRRYIIALSLIALLAIAAQVLVQYSLALREHDSRIINLAGRQRLLAQTMRRASLVILTASSPAIRQEGMSELRRALQEWNRAHQLLQSGGGAMGRNPQEVCRLFQRLKPHHQAMFSSARRLLATAEGSAAKSVQAELAANIIYHGGLFLELMDQTVAAYERASRQAVHRLRLVEIGLTILMLLALALEALFIFRPAVRRIRQGVEQLREAAEHLWQLSQLDGLTGVPNRRYFDDAFLQEWRRAARAGRSLAMIMLDIDHFKRFNDAYGHQAGDQALQTVAQTVQDQLKRPGDFLARYGGEEFVVVLPDTSLEGAVRLAEAIRRQVEAQGIEHRDSPTGGVVTVSLGAAAVRPDPASCPEGLLQATDQALYRAKQAGRNQVLSAGDTWGTSAEAVSPGGA